MKPVPRRLTRRYIIFITVVIGLLFSGTFLITTSVVTSGLVDLFRQRLERSGEVLAQFEAAHTAFRKAELESVLSSPRFLAAMETGDPETITPEARAFERQLGSSFVLITDLSGLPFYQPNKKHQASALVLADLQKRLPDRFMIRTCVVEQQLVEYSMQPILSNAGVPIGILSVANEVGDEVVRDLSRLVGCDVLLSHGEEIISRSSATLLQHPDLSTLMAALVSSSSTATGQPVSRDGMLIVQHPMTSLDATVTFLASIDQHVDPIRSQIMLLLAVLGLAGLLMSVAAIWLYTSRKVGRQIDVLVSSAERIGSGDLDFRVAATTSDELGYLASSLDQMRERIQSDRLEIERAHARRIESERMAAMGNMMAGIVHDFKNPMAVIRGSAELLQTGTPKPEKLLRHCGTITSQIDRMNDLVRDLLEYARGQSNLSLQPTALQPYLESVVAFHLPAFEQAAIRLQVVDSLPITLQLDPNRLRRVLDNILTNAREALSPGHAVWLLWQLGSDHVELQIKDNGPGIPPQILPTLFEPFVTSNKEHGTGLGLAIARKIVEDHHARITVESSQETGTAFHIWFPVAAVVEGAAAIAEKQEARITEVNV